MAKSRKGLSDRAKTKNLAVTPRRSGAVNGGGRVFRFANVRALVNGTGGGPSDGR
jgi:hypothetical protein